MLSRKARFIILILVFIFSGFLWTKQRGDAIPLSLSEVLEFSYPEYAADNAGELFVIDNAKRRVTVIDNRQQVIAEIVGGSRRPGEFFYAIELAPIPEEGSFFLLNNVLDDDGYYLVREEILKYDRHGKMVAKIHERTYSEKDRTMTLVQRGRIRGLKFRDGHLSWFEVDDQSIIPYRWSTSGDRASVGTPYPLADAAYSIAKIRPHPESGWVHVTKNGRIERVTAVADNYRTELLYAAPADNFSIVPWELAVDNDGEVFFIDLVGRSIRRIVDQENAVEVFNHALLNAAGQAADPFNYYRLTMSPSSDLITCNDLAVIRWGQDGTVKTYLTAAPYSSDILVARYLHWIVSLVFVTTGLLLAYFGGSYLISLSPQMFYLSAAIVGAVVLSASVVSWIIFPSLIKQYEDVLFQKISFMLQTAPKTVDGDLFAEVKGMEDFNGDAYRKIHESFLSSLNYNRDAWNRSSYFAVYRIMDGKLYGMMYLNGAIGMMHPFDWLGQDSVYDRASAGEIATEMTRDISGEWLYGVSPIYDSAGKLVALFETGTDLYAFKLANEALQRKLMLQVGTMLVILIIIMIELVFLYQTLQKRHQFRTQMRQGLSVDLGDYSDVLLGRTAKFIYTFAVSMSLAFIPLAMNQFYEEIPGFSREFLLAMPLSLEMFAFGLSTFVGGQIVKHTGWRVLFVTGLLVTMAGLLFSGSAWDMASFAAARMMTGLGSGMGYIAIRVFINQEQRIDCRSQGYSHFYAGLVAGINAGVVLGASIADETSYSTVFFAAAVVLSLCLLFYIGTMLRTPFMSLRIDEEERMSSRAAFLSIVSDRRMWLFFGCLLLPTYVAGTFLTYYLPLFAESEGLTTADIGRLFILNGLFIIYFGPPLSKLLRERWGDHLTQVIGSVCWALSLMIFAMTGTLWGVVIALIIMGITEGFCAVSQNEYFLEMVSSNGVDEDSATSYFEMIGKLGETLGPIGFSVALLFGQSAGLFGLGLAVLILTIPAWLLLGPPRRSVAAPA